MVRLIIAATILSLASLGTCSSSKPATPKTAGPPPPPAAEVLVGKPIKWRTLYARKYANNVGGTFGELLAGSFSSPGKAELLLLGYGDAIAFNPTGEVAKFQIGQTSFQNVYRFGAWDANGDGIAELFNRPEHYLYAGTANTPVQTTRTWLLNGSPGPRLEKGILNSLVGAHSRLRDYDGDGSLDIAVRPNVKGSAVTIYKAGPQVLATIPKVKGWTGTSYFTDSDGDGKAELIQLGMDGDQVNYFACRDGIPAKLLGSRPKGGTGALACFDLNGDKIDELVLAQAIYDFKQGISHDLQFPPGTAPQNLLGIRPVECGKFLAGEGTLVAMPVSPQRFGRTGICLFRNDGTCVYYEEFGDRVGGLGKLTDNGRDYIVVQLDERILIYP